MCDTIHGDDHRATQISDHKAGPFRSLTVYSAATALPPGFIEGYANKGGRHGARACVWRPPGAALSEAGSSQR